MRSIIFSIFILFSLPASSQESAKPTVPEQKESFMHRLIRSREDAAAKRKESREQQEASFSEFRDPNAAEASLIRYLTDNWQMLAREYGFDPGTNGFKPANRLVGNVMRHCWRDLFTKFEIPIGDVSYSDCAVKSATDWLCYRYEFSSARAPKSKLHNFHILVFVSPDGKRSVMTTLIPPGGPTRYSQLLRWVEGLV